MIVDRPGSSRLQITASTCAARMPASNVLAWARPQESADRPITLSSVHTTEIVSILRTVTDALYASQPQEMMLVMSHHLPNH